MYQLLVLCLAGWSGLTVTALPLLAAKVVPGIGLGTGVQGLLAVGLALGYWLGGRLSAKAPSLQKQAAIFLVATWTATPVVLLADSIRQFVAQVATGEASVALLFAGLLLWLPTALFGMVPAFAVRLGTQNVFDSGAAAGRSFGCWAAGVALACVGIPQSLAHPAGADWVLWSLAAGAILFGGLALMLGRHLSRETGLP